MGTNTWHPFCAAQSSTLPHISGHEPIPVSSSECISGYLLGVLKCSHIIEAFLRELSGHQVDNPGHLYSEANLTGFQ